MFNNGYFTFLFLCTKSSKSSASDPIWLVAVLLDNIDIGVSCGRANTHVEGCTSIKVVAMKKTQSMATLKNRKGSY